MRRKGYHPVIRERVITKRRAEFDRAVRKGKSGPILAVEVKDTKQPVGLSAVKKFKKKIDKETLYRGGIMVSKRGFSKEAIKGKPSGIKLLKYKQKRKRETSWSFS